jgi:hypothetical protein
MLKRIAVSSIVTFLMLGAPSMAFASGGWWGDDNKGDKGGDHDHSRAPEPVTMIGLALGAAGIAGVRWAKRKSARKV